MTQFFLLPCYPQGLQRNTVATTDLFLCPFKIHSRVLRQCYDCLTQTKCNCFLLEGEKLTCLFIT